MITHIIFRSINPIITTVNTNIEKPWSIEPAINHEINFSETANESQSFPRTIDTNEVSKFPDDTHIFSKHKITLDNVNQFAESGALCKRLTIIIELDKLHVRATLVAQPKIPQKWTFGTFFPTRI